MKRIAFTIAAILAVASTVYAQSSSNPITIGEINLRSVMGGLGLTLGTPAEIQAQIVAGRDLERKAYNGLYLLKVTHVNGTQLDEPRLFTFSVPGFVHAHLATTEFELHKLKHGAEPGSLSTEQLAELDQGYVGNTVRLVVYEVGSFSGIPSDLPEDVPMWADVPFHFSTSLRVVAQRD